MLIYQLLPRLFGNPKTLNFPNGSIEENGCGKFSFFTPAVLKKIKRLGATHIWLTGLIRHATTTDYSAYGIPRQHPDVIKGKAGSPYAICDYYDIDPDLADNPADRMAEFEALVDRIHAAGLKLVIDFVPNHVARQYHSICKPEWVKDLGEDDNQDWHFSPQNNFYYLWGQSFSVPGNGRTQGAPLQAEQPPVGAGLVSARQRPATGGSVAERERPVLGDYFAEPYQEHPAKATGNDCFSPTPSKNDWYETVKLNYGIDYCDAGGRSEHFNPIPDTWNKMTAILLFWAGKGIDAFRCDMAEMVPSAFWHWATDKVKFTYPDIKFIGEVYCPDKYREYIHAGFDYLYDKVGLYDCLKEVVQGRRSAQDITRQWQAVDDIQHHMLNFLENHDEQRIASDYFAGSAQKGIPALVVSLMLNTNPFMLYAGQEFGERGMDCEGFSGTDGRTTIFDYWNPQSLYRGYVNRRKLSPEEKAIERQYLHLLNIATTERAITEGKTYDLMYCNPQSPQFNAHRIFAFLRSYTPNDGAPTETLLILANFSDKEETATINIPQHALDYLNIQLPVLGGSVAESERPVLARTMGESQPPVPGDYFAGPITLPPHQAKILKLCSDSVSNIYPLP